MPRDRRSALQGFRAIGWTLAQPPRPLPTAQHPGHSRGGSGGMAGGGALGAWQCSPALNTASAQQSTSKYVLTSGGCLQITTYMKCSNLVALPALSI